MLKEDIRKSKRGTMMTRKLDEREIDKIFEEFGLYMNDDRYSILDQYEKIITNRNDYGKLDDKDKFFDTFSLILDEMIDICDKYQENILDLWLDDEEKDNMLKIFLSEISVRDLEYNKILEQLDIVRNAEFSYMLTEEYRNKKIEDYSNNSKKGIDYKCIVNDIKKDIIQKYDIISRQDSCNLLEIINLIVENDRCLNDEESYILDGKKIDLNEVKSNLEKERKLLQGILDNMNPYEGISLKELDYIDDYIYIDSLYIKFFALVRKWFITHNDMDLKEIIKMLTEDIMYGISFVVDPPQVYGDKYKKLYSSEIDSSLCEWIININQYIENRKEYIDVYLKEKKKDDELKKKAISAIKKLACWGKCEDEMVDCDWQCHKFLNEYMTNSKLNYESMSVYDFCLESDKMDINKDVNIREDDVEKLGYIYDVLDEKIESFMCDKDNNSNEGCVFNEDDIKEYIQYTRSLSLDEALLTGRLAFKYIVSNIEIINLMKLVLREMLNEDNKYGVAYELLANIMDIVVTFEYNNPHVFFDKADSEAMISVTEKYKIQKVMELNFKFVTSFAKNDIEELMKCKKEIRPLYLSEFPWLIEEFDRNIEMVIEKLRQQILEQNVLLVKKDALDFLNTYNCGNMLSDHMKKTFITAEYLFNKYIEKKEADSEMDYSFISIMYYQVLEIALNELIFSRYVSQIDIDITLDEAANYFGKYKDDKKNVSFYMTSRGYGTNKVYTCKKSIELGNLGHFLKLIDKNIYLEKFISEEYKRCNKQKLLKLGDNILNIKDRRNNAAHGVYVNYETSKEDKVIIYTTSSEFEESVQIRNLLIDLLIALG